MNSEIIAAFLIGFGTGLFLIFGGAYILKRTFKLMDSPQQNEKGDSNLSWSFSQALGLASLWTGKIVLACAILYFCQKWGFSTKAMGVGIPVGIILGSLLINKKTDLN